VCAAGHESTQAGIAFAEAANMMSILAGSQVGDQSRTLDTAPDMDMPHIARENLMTEPNILEAIRSLPPNWHQSGSLNFAVVEYLYRCAEGAQETAETGCGKSTLALSNASRRHLVFALDVMPGDNPERHSLAMVRDSPLFQRDSCEFVLGPTQKTLPCFDFARTFDLVLLDGPHGYPFPELEYFFFYPHIRPGGWLVIDDIHIPTIAHMVDVLKSDAMFQMDRVIRTTAFLRRTTAPTFPPTGDGWWEQNYNTRFGVALRHVGIRSKPRVIALELKRRFGGR
jgi:predicted O-methyltransferase YrrM